MAGIGDAALGLWLLLESMSAALRTRKASADNDVEGNESAEVGAMKMVQVVVWALGRFKDPGEEEQHLGTPLHTVFSVRSTVVCARVRCDAS